MPPQEFFSREASEGAFALLGEKHRRAGKVIEISIDGEDHSTTWTSRALAVEKHTCT